MCTVTINIDETQVRKVYPSLTDMESITRWAQHLVDRRIADLLEIRSRERLEPYTIEELHARIAESERQSARGEVFDFDDVIREIEEELAREEEFELAEAI